MSYKIIILLVLVLLLGGVVFFGWFKWEMEKEKNRKLSSKLKDSKTHQEKMKREISSLKTQVRETQGATEQFLRATAEMDRDFFLTSQQIMDKATESAYFDSNYSTPPMSYGPDFPAEDSYWEEC